MFNADSAPNVPQVRSLVIVHAVTGERRKLNVLRGDHREIEGQWPQVGALRFRVRDGRAVSKDAQSWRVSPLSLVMLHRQHKIPTEESFP